MLGYGNLRYDWTVKPHCRGVLFPDRFSRGRDRMVERPTFGPETRPREEMGRAFCVGRLMVSRYRLGGPELIHSSLEVMNQRLHREAGDLHLRGAVASRGDTRQPAAGCAG